MTVTPQTLENEPSRHTAELTVALAGNPNVGKTTLFNALTGLKQKVANYPGVTVEKKSGRCLLKKSAIETAADDATLWCTIIDLPGTYSLASRSPDEHVARQVVLGQIEGTPQPDVMCVVVDASNLERNLYLLTQVMELACPTIVALSMCDIADKQGRPVNVEKLSMHLRLPVIPVQAHKGIGIDQLKNAIRGIAGKRVERLELPLPEVMETHIERLQRILREEKLAAADQAEWDAHIMLTTGDDDDVPDRRRDHPRVRGALSAAIDDLAQHDIDPIAAEIEAHYSYIGSIVHDCIIVDDAAAKDGKVRATTTATDRIDRVLTHKVWGMAIFVVIMGLVFVSIFSWAQPIMDFLQNTVIGGLGSLVGNHMADGPLKDLLVNGVITGVGNVMAFLPQIALLFMFLAILEDSGYMSRAAFLMDRLMSKVGLHGKSFIPLLSGFACAVPAIMGTRVIENRRDRLATILVLPLMSCSARLPIYSMMIGMFFTGALLQGGIMLAMYALGTIAAFGMAFIFKRTLLRGPAPAFILEMPPYRMPHWKTVANTVLQRSWQFLKRAGTVIFAFSVLMWAGTNYPKPAAFMGKPQPGHFSQDFDKLIQDKAKELEPYKFVHDFYEQHKGQKISTATPPELPNQNERYQQISDELDVLQNAQGQEILENSIAGRAGKFIEPAFYPLGFDWKLSVGVTGAFFAREVLISTMGIVYSVGAVDPGDPGALKDAMVKDTWPAGSARAGQPIYTKLVAISVMVFVVFCMQCLSTLAITKREMGHIGWPIFMFAYMTAMAWIAAFAVYQGGRLLGLG